MCKVHSTVGAQKVRAIVNVIIQVKGYHKDSSS